MKTTARLIFYAGVLITLDCRQLAAQKVGTERGPAREAQGVKEQIPPPRPSFPLLTLPSFSSFSLPGLNFPYLQAFSSPNRVSSADHRVRATKTEYVEVTRRQTVHPVCYTAYEAKSPCLPYALDLQGDDDDNFDSEAVHHAHDSFNLNEVRSVIRATPTVQAGATEVLTDATKEEPERTGRYLQLKLRREGQLPETSSKIEGSEFFPTLNRIPQHQQSTEYHTKTVLITKLEKYTDRRVTATLLAVNCLPVDRSIPLCQNYPSPIRESPDRRSDDYVDLQSAGNYSPTLTDSENLGSAEFPKMESNPTYGGNKTAGSRFSESVEANSEEALSGED